MSPRLHQSADQSKVKPICLARYAGRCSCGRKIHQGQQIAFDIFAKTVQCMNCFRAGATPAHPRQPTVEPNEQAKIIVDRINQLKALPGTPGAAVQEELKDLVNSLKQNHASDLYIRKFLFSNARNKYSGSKLYAISAKFSGKCRSCGNEQLVGTTVLYDAQEKKIYCVDCSDATCI